MSFHTDAVELVKKMTLDEKLSQLRYDAPAIERLENPRLQLVERRAPRGCPRRGPPPIFPQAIGMAAIL